MGSVRVAAAAVGAAVLMSLLGPLQASQAQTQPASDPMVAPQEMTDRMIVGLVNSRVADATVEAVTESAALASGLTVQPEVVDSVTPTTAVVSLGGALPVDDVEQLSEVVAASTAISYAEPDRIMQVAALPNDQFAANLWGLSGTYGTRALDAWPTTRGSGVVVAVIDTGITQHPDLDAQVVSGFDFVSVAQVANDGDGWDGDPADPGDWVTLAEKSQPFFSECRVTNSSWHGTHVAGTVAAVAGNTIGVAGIAPDTRILPVRALGKCGGYVSDIATAILWSSGETIPGVRANTTPARVINLSLGGEFPCSSQTTLQDAVTTAVGRGSVVVAAAGNEYGSVTNSSPASCTGAIAVGAHDSSGNRPAFSNTGSLVAISGPGVNVLSTYNTGDTTPGSSDYDYLSGTSMATPHVAATAAMLVAQRPSLTPAEVVSILRSTSRPFTGASGCTTQCGARYVDAQAAVASLATTPTPDPDPSPPPPPPPPPAPVVTVPGAPTIPQAIAQDRSITLGWGVPASTGGAAISSYVVEVEGPGVSLVEPATATALVVDGLVNGVTYRARVAAVNSAGTGAFTAWLEGLMPLGPASAPTAVRATPGDRSATLSWVAPVETGGAPIDVYVIELTSPSASMSIESSQTQSVVTGLDNGTSYSVRVAARTAAGAGTWSQPTVVTPRAPRVSAPLDVQVRKVRGGIVVSWRAPATGLAEGYVVQASIDNDPYRTKARTDGTRTAFTVPSRASLIKVRVAAIGEAGRGSFSAPATFRVRRA